MDGAQERGYASFGLGRAFDEGGVFRSAEEMLGFLFRELTKRDLFATALGLFPRQLGDLGCSRLHAGTVSRLEIGVRDARCSERLDERISLAQVVAGQSVL